MNNSNQSKNQKGPAQGGPKQNNRNQQPKRAQAKRKYQPRNGQSSVVSAPVAKTVVSTMRHPQYENLPNGDVIIRHREFVTNIVGNENFVVSRFPINPGLQALFPWLSTVAPSYESYVFEKLDFLYETSCNTIATGTVTLAVDYDPNDPTPIDKVQALAYFGSVRSSPWASSCHSSSSQNLRKRKTYFVRSGEQSNTQFLTTMDVGQLYVCRDGMLDQRVVGELYSSYTIRLMTPQLGNQRVGEAKYGTFLGSNNNVTTGNMFAVRQTTSNIEMDASNISPTVTTWTFTAPWAGIVLLKTNGSGMNTGATRTQVTTSGLGQTTLLSNIATSATSIGMALWFSGAAAGDVISILVDNAGPGSITDADAWLGQANV